MESLGDIPSFLQAGKSGKSEDDTTADPSETAGSFSGFRAHERLITLPARALGS